MKRYRDIQLIEKDTDTWLAVACDVSAAIGDKAMDVVKVSPWIAGYYAAAVPIIETQAIGGETISIADTIGVAMDSTGESIISGIREAMSEADISGDCLIGSTEDNMPTVTTSIGITVIAEVTKASLKDQTPKPGECLLVVGLPKMGQQFLEEEIHGKMGDVINIGTVRKVRRTEGVSHILPVGSKGIGYELEVLKKMYGLTVAEEALMSVDLTASAGPATCMIVSCNEQAYASLEAELSMPCNLIGQIGEGCV